MRSVDLALYADALAARASALAARVERERDALRQAAVERAARRDLDDATVSRLEALGALSRRDVRVARAELSRLAADLAAVERLQAWVEERLFEAREESDVCRRSSARVRPLRPRREGDQEPAVLVVGGEEVGADALHHA